MWTKTLREDSISANEEQVQVFVRRSALRESLLSNWRVDIPQALRVTKDREVEVGTSEVSRASWDRFVMTRGQVEVGLNGCFIRRTMCLTFFQCFRTSSLQQNGSVSCAGPLSGTTG